MASVPSMSEDEYREHVRKLVDTFPPVTTAQKVEIGMALRQGVARRGLEKSVELRLAG